VQDGPKLIYNLATGNWLLHVKDDFWKFRSTSESLTMAGYLQVNVVDKSTSDYLVVTKGYVSISSATDTECVIALKPLSKDEKASRVTVFPQNVNFGTLDCHLGFHSDLWIETDAIMIIESIQSLGLKFYLPKSIDQKEKSLECFIGRKKVAAIAVGRGDPQEVWFDVANHSKGPQEVRFKCAYKEPNLADERNLGMIFVEYNINRTEWMPAGDLL